MSESEERIPQSEMIVHEKGSLVDAAEYETVAMAVVGAVAAAEGVSEISLPPLYDAGIDPDALNELFEGSRTHVEGLFSFTYAEYVVTVTSGEDVTVEAHRTV
ncbi:HalOD1 output domain-containing protein [Halopelagius fulvigenes]|uniref:HalOD1 output domain-containing protein n=1 Tax=Halopelagius fulvigenes TaxID=1198324 RepID=A0ABD5U3A5_9EURY